MRFQSDVESLTVLVGQGKYCKFINGVYETEDTSEIAALQRAKGVREIKTPDKNAEVKTNPTDAKPAKTIAGKPRKSQIKKKKR